MLKIAIEITANTEPPYYTDLEAAILGALDPARKHTTDAVTTTAQGSTAPAPAPQAPAPAADAAEPQADEQPAKAPRARRTRKAAAEPTQKEELDQLAAEEEANALAAAEAAGVTEAETAPEADEDDADMLGAEEPQAYTLEDAIAKATVLVSAGKGGIVKGALADQGAKRVSELKTAKAITAFINAIDSEA